MQRINHFVPERHVEQFRSLARQTEIPVAELMRRMFDFCLKPDVINVIVPSMSGQVRLDCHR